MAMNKNYGSTTQWSCQCRLQIGSGRWEREEGGKPWDNGVIGQENEALTLSPCDAEPERQKRAKDMPLVLWIAHNSRQRGCW